MNAMEIATKVITEYIKKKAEDVFTTKITTTELIDEVYAP
jgi:hypothetical protein